MLSFSNLAGVFGTFQDPDENSRFQEKVSNGLKVREEIRRNSKDLVDKISNHTGIYSCVDIRGTGKEGLEGGKQAAVAQGFIRQDETLFLASEHEALQNTEGHRAATGWDLSTLILILTLTLMSRLSSRWLGSYISISTLSLD